MAAILTEEALSGALTAAYEQFITRGMDLVDELISLRVSRGVSQTAVAAAVGVKPSAVNHWEAKRAKPSGSALILLENLVADLRKRKPLKSEQAA